MYGFLNKLISDNCHLVMNLVWYLALHKNNSCQWSCLSGLCKTKKEDQLKRCERAQLLNQLIISNLKCYHGGTSVQTLFFFFFFTHEAKTWIKICHTTFCLYRKGPRPLKVSVKNRFIPRLKVGKAIFFFGCSSKNTNFIWEGGIMKQKKGSLFFF